jgi:hypothetical protein
MALNTLRPMADVFSAKRNSDGMLFFLLPMVADEMQTPCVGDDPGSRKTQARGRSTRHEVTFFSV